MTTKRAQHGLHLRHADLFHSRLRGNHQFKPLFFSARLQSLRHVDFGHSVKGPFSGSCTRFPLVSELVQPDFSFVSQGYLETAEYVSTSVPPDGLCTSQARCLFYTDGTVGH